MGRGRAKGEEEIKVIVEGIFDSLIFQPCAFSRAKLSLTMEVNLTNPHCILPTTPSMQVPLFPSISRSINASFTPPGFKEQHQSLVHHKPTMNTPNIRPPTTRFSPSEIQPDLSPTPIPRTSLSRSLGYGGRRGFGRRGRGGVPAELLHEVVARGWYALPINVSAWGGRALRMRKGNPRLPEPGHASLITRACRESRLLRDGVGPPRRGRCHSYFLLISFTPRHTIRTSLRAYADIHPSTLAGALVARDGTFNSKARRAGKAGEGKKREI